MFLVFWVWTMHAGWVQNKTHKTSTSEQMISGLGNLLAFCFVPVQGGGMGDLRAQKILQMSYKSRPLAALAHFELGRVCGRGEDELLFRSEESLRLAEREESLQCEEKRRLRYIWVGGGAHFLRPRSGAGLRSAR